MDIPALSMAMSQSQLLSQVSTQVMSMSMDQVEASGDEMAKMMEMSVNPSVGGNIDISL